MAAYTTLPPRMAASGISWQGGLGFTYADGDDPVPPHFATRYASRAPAVPTLPLRSAPQQPMPQPYWPSGEPKYCVAPCCAGLKTGTVPAYLPLRSLPPPSHVQLMAAVPHGAPHLRTSSSEVSYKEPLGRFPAVETSFGQDARPLVTIPPLSQRHFDLTDIDHPSYYRPPHRDAPYYPSDVRRASANGICLPVEEPSPLDSGYCSATASPVYNLYDLIPVEPMPAPAPLAIEVCGAQIADATASVLFDTYAGRFGAVGSVSPSRSALPPSAPAIEGGLPKTSRGDFHLFVREVLIGTRVAISVVVNAVSYLCDTRLRNELKVRSLQLSLVAALSVSHKTLDDSPFTTATWAKLAKLDFDQLRTAERALCYGLAFNVRPELDRERFVDASDSLLQRLSPEAPGRALLFKIVDKFIKAV